MLLRAFPQCFQRFYCTVLVFVCLVPLCGKGKDSTYNSTSNSTLIINQKKEIDSLLKLNSALDLASRGISEVEIVSARFEEFKFWATIFITIFVAVGALSVWNVHQTAKSTARSEAEKELERIRNQYSTFQDQIEKSFVDWFQEIKEKEAYNRLKGRK